MDDDGHSPAGAASECSGSWVVPELWLPAVPATAERLLSARRDLERWSDSAGLSTDQVADVGLAAYEAMANVVDHAYLHSDGDFDLHAVRDRSRIAVTITDRGRWKQPPAVLSPRSLRGRGLLLMEKLAARLEIAPRPCGTTVRMIWPVLCPDGC